MGAGWRLAVGGMSDQGLLGLNGWCNNEKNFCPVTKLVCSTHVTLCDRALFRVSGYAAHMITAAQTLGLASEPEFNPVSSACRYARRTRMGTRWSLAACRMRACWAPTAGATTTCPATRRARCAPAAWTGCGATAATSPPSTSASTSAGATGRASWASVSATTATTARTAPGGGGGSWQGQVGGSGFLGFMMGPGGVLRVLGFGAHDGARWGVQGCRVVVCFNMGPGGVRVLGVSLRFIQPSQVASGF